MCLAVKAKPESHEIQQLWLHQRALDFQKYSWKTINIDHIQNTNATKIL